LLSKYDFDTVRDIVKEVERLKRKDRGLFKNDLLSIVQGIRLAFVASNTKKGAGYYKRWFDRELRGIHKMLEIDKPTVWENLRSKSKRI